MSHQAQTNGGFSPRELRRQKFQEAAAVTIDRQARAIQQTREVMADVSQRVDALQMIIGNIELSVLKRHEHIGRVEAVLNALTDDFLALRRRTFWGRLRWLFTGR